MKKIPYNNKRVYHKTVISQVEYDQIIDEASVAKQLLTDEKFEFVRQILLSAKEYAKNSILENTVMDVAEEVTVSDRIKKIFRQPKKIQVDELSGQYKLVKKFFDELEGYIATKKNLEEQINSDQVIVDAK